MARFCLLTLAISFALLTEASVAGVKKLVARALDAIAGYQYSTVGSRGQVLSAKPNADLIPCPDNSESLGVLVVIGQSNISNTGAYRFTREDTPNVLNYFDGACYEASSPMLGASGARGEWISLLGQELVDQGVYENVLVAPYGIAGASIRTFAEGGALAEWLKASLGRLTESHGVTDVVWHQGETDARLGVSSTTYAALFSSAYESVAASLGDAKVFLTVASLCARQNEVNALADASALIIERHPSIAEGIPSDDLIPVSLRWDGCHFDERGQRLAAQAAASLIKSHYCSPLGQTAGAPSSRCSSRE